MKRKSLTSIIITVFVFFLLMAGSSMAADKVIKWTTQSIFPAGSSLYKEFEVFAKRVKVATNGRLEITTHPVGAVVGYREMIDALKTGILQGYYSSATFFSGKEPAFTIITGLPGGYENIPQFESWFYQKGGMDFLRRAHKKFGNYPVGVVFYGRETLPCKVPIRTLADFKGKKIRGPEGVIANQFRALGASTVSMPGSEVYSALDKGVIDAADWGTTSMNDQMGLYEACKYNIDPGFHSMGALEFTVTQKTWDSLPKDIQAILTAEVRYWSAMAVARLIKEDAEVAPKLKKLGVETITFSDKTYREIREITRKTWLDWAKKNALSKEVVDSHIAFCKELGLIN